MFEKNFKEFTFYVNSDSHCMLRVPGPQGKAIAFGFTTNELEEFQRLVDWALGRMYKLEKVNYDAKIEDAHAQMKFEL